MSAIGNELIGYQTPRLAHYPTYFTSLGDDAIDLAGACGLELLPWQEDIVRVSLGEAVDHRWCSSSVCLIIPRQNGKNVCVYARQLAGLFLLGERIMHSAHEFDTCRDAHRELTTFIGNCEELEDECILPHKVGAAEMSIRHKSNKGFIHYVARGKNAKRGRTKVDLMIFDEAFALDDHMMGSMSPLQQASLNPQKWFTTSAGTEDSVVLTRIRERGKRLDETPDDSSKLLYAEWSCEEGSDPHEFENWKLSNPSLGVEGIAPVDYLREDYEQNMDLAQFAREHLGMWDDPAMSSVISLSAWKDCIGESPAEVGERVVCVDVEPNRQWASIAIAEKHSDGRHHVAVIAHDAGTKWIIPTMTKLMASPHPPKAAVVQLGAQSGVYAPELEQLGYKVYTFGTKDVGQATMQFEDDIIGNLLTHEDDVDLKIGLGGATKYFIGNEDFSGAWGWLRKNAGIDITGIVACSYANRALTLEGVEKTLNTKRPGKLLMSGQYQ